MKIYRCPCCGEACLSSADKLFYIDGNRRRYAKTVRSNVCPCCNERFTPQKRYKGVGLLLIELELLGILGGIVYATFAIHWTYILLFLLFGLLLAFVFVPMTNRSLALVRYDLIKREPLFPEPNATAEITEGVGRIENLDILGIRFDKHTPAVRFEEAFTNRLVPVVFYKTHKRQKGALQITIMKRGFIPDTLLQEGAAFTVVDNGREIARGILTDLRSRPLQKQKWQF